MKKLSLIGLVLGAIFGMLVAMVFGKWLFWLGVGLAIGLLIGSARRSPIAESHAIQRRAIL